MPVEKPWGNFQLISKNEKTSIKILNINAGHRLSLQYHNKRKEKWMIIAGRATAIIECVKHSLGPGDEVTIHPTKQHRLEAISNTTVLEISYGEFDEEDIVRIHDDYNR